MRKRESEFSLLFRHWLRANPQFNCAYELKQALGGSLAFAALEDHQIDYLLAIEGPKGVLVRVQGTNGEPDYIYLRNCPAMVVIRYPKQFSIIPINGFLLEKKRSLRKSLTSARAAEISILTVKLSTSPA